jgi:hypothetical protein
MPNLLTEKRNHSVDKRMLKPRKYVGLKDNHLRVVGRLDSCLCLFGIVVYKVLQVRILIVGTEMFRILGFVVVGRTTKLAALSRESQECSLEPTVPVIPVDRSEESVVQYLLEVGRRQTIARRWIHEPNGNPLPCFGEFRSSIRGSYLVSSSRIKTNPLKREFDHKIFTVVGNIPYARLLQVTPTKTRPKTDTTEHSDTERVIIEVIVLSWPPLATSSWRSTRTLS